MHNFKHLEKDIILYYLKELNRFKKKNKKSKLKNSSQCVPKSLNKGRTI